MRTHFLLKTVTDSQGSDTVDEDFKSELDSELKREKEEIINKLGVDPDAPASPPAQPKVATIRYADMHTVFTATFALTFCPLSEILLGGEQWPTKRRERLCMMKGYCATLYVVFGTMKTYANLKTETKSCHSRASKTPYPVTHFEEG